MTERTGAATRRDEGTVLVLALLLTSLLAVVVIGLATYATAGVAGSRATTDRVEARSAASAVLQWQIEEYTHKRAAPCTADETIPVPMGVAADASSMSLRCVATASVDGHPTSLVVATAEVNGVTAAVTAMVQVPNRQYVTNVLRWSGY